MFYFYNIYASKVTLQPSATILYYNTTKLLPTVVAENDPSVLAGSW